MSDNGYNREPVRIYLTGNCDGLEPLRDALHQHDDVEVVGFSEHVADAYAPLAGGHLQVVLHGTRDAHLPVHEIASMREHTQAPLILLASGESSQLLNEALDTDVADVLLLPQLADNVVFAIRKAAHAGRRLEAEGGHGRRGRVLTVFSPKGGTGKTVTATNIATAFAM
jgi:Flp pilus assembly CpaE family ATPase